MTRAYGRSVHLVERLRLPEPYSARPYLGHADHAAMCDVLRSYRTYAGNAELPTVAEIDAAYGHLTNCDPTTDMAIIEAAGAAVGYVRTQRTVREDGGVDVGWFAPIVGDHWPDTSLYAALVDGIEPHVSAWVVPGTDARCRVYVLHPGPDHDPTGPARVLAERGYEVQTWAAALVRPHLDDIPARTLPAGVDVRPVAPDQVRPIWWAFFEAFRGEWGFNEPSPEMVDSEIANPHHDPSLWKIAWADDQIVGQVKSYINHESNAITGRRRGYTEDIATHHDWRNQGIAGALLAMSLHELRDRGMTEAALGVDTSNPGGALHLYTSMGFEPVSYGAVYVTSIGASIDDETA